MAVSVSVYNQFKTDILNSNIALTADTIKVALMTNSSTFTAGNTVWSDVSANEISAANGYTAGGVALTTKAVTNNGTSSAFTADNATWTASGGAITAYKAVMYDVTFGANRLMLFIDFGGSNTAGDGTQFIVKWNASGILTLS